jgi:predicted ATP-dependent serine protease
MDCTSGRSKICSGVGHSAWGGKCSNCADYEDLPSKLRVQQDRDNERAEARLEALELSTFNSLPPL